MLNPDESVEEDGGLLKLLAFDTNLNSSDELVFTAKELDILKEIQDVKEIYFYIYFNLN